MLIDESEFVCILDDVLKSLFGDVARDLFYDFLNRNFSLSKYQILQNISLFIEALISTFGEQGTKLVEREILLAIEAKISYERNESKLTSKHIDEYASKLRNYANYLCKNDAKTYIALLSNGELPARKLAKIAIIPRSKIYHAIKRLQNMEMISIRRFQDITLIKPKNPKKVFKDHIDLMNNRLMSFTQFVKELSELYKCFSLSEELDSLEQLKPIKKST